ncbi:MAG: hypothetical protein IIC94_08340 [Chloroflexi bacterium]|nr:hypothetical protein [Chloroflexota bacterium]
MTTPNKQRTNGSMYDIRTMLAASSADDGAPLPGMLARAMVYSQDADRKLDHARAMKQEAAKYRDEVQRQTLEQTEAFCAEARAKAEADYDDARKLRADAEETYDAARAELARAATVRADADAYAASARTEADDHADGVRSDASTYAGTLRAEADAYRRTAEAQAAADTTTLKDQAQREAAADVAEQKERMEDEVRQALRAVEKMQSAVQAELEAQQMYTEALRFRTAAPAAAETAPVAPRRAVPKGSRTAKRRAA